MKIVQIRSGKFKLDTMNFTGFTLGRKISVFVPAAMIDNLIPAADIDAEGRVKSTTFYALVDTKEYQTRDESGELAFDENNEPIMFKREEALLISVKKQDVLDAYNEEAELLMDAEVDLQSKAKKLGLHPAAVNQLLKAAAEV